MDETKCKRLIIKGMDNSRGPDDFLFASFLSETECGLGLCTTQFLTE